MDENNPQPWSPEASQAAANKLKQQSAAELQQMQKQFGEGKFGNLANPMDQARLAQAFGQATQKASPVEQIKATWTDEMAKAYAERQRKRFAEELPFAEQYLAGMESGELSQALQAQKLGMGQTAAQQAIMAASGAPKAPGGMANPLAAREAMFAGGQAALDVAGRGAEARGQEIGGALDQALQAQLRQSAYEQQLRGILAERERMTKMAEMSAKMGQLQAQGQMQQQQQQATGAILGAIGGATQQGIKVWGGAKPAAK